MSAASADDGKAHYCYALWQPGCPPRSSRTYVGYTVDPARRLRQHNGEIAGGARRTRAGGHGSWALLFVVEVEDAGRDVPRFAQHQALSLEWHLKRANKKCGRKKGPAAAGPAPEPKGVARRIEFLAGALLLPKFAAFLPHVVVHADPRHADAVWATLARALPPGCCCVECQLPA